MKIKTSVSLDKQLLKKVDRLSRRYKNRSELIEAALHAHVARINRHERDSKDLDTINRIAGALNKEALDVLDYQVTL